MAHIQKFLLELGQGAFHCFRNIMCNSKSLCENSKVGLSFMPEVT